MTLATKQQNQNDNMTTETTTPATPTPAPAPATDTMRQYKHEVAPGNIVTLDVTLMETERVKAGNQPVKSWGLDLGQFDVYETVETGKDDKGQPVTVKRVNEPATLAAIARAIGYNQLLVKLQSKLNADIRGAQMENGKDIYNLDEKFAYFEAYVKSGFGAEKTGGIQAAVNAAVSKLQSSMQTIIKRQAEIGAKLADSATPATEYPALIAEMMSLTAQAGSLATVAK